ncbi:MAG: AMP-binding protein [Acidimicrobiales bacterium]
MPTGISSPLGAALAVARAAIIPERPDRLARAALAALPWGATLAGGVAAASARYPLAVAVKDDLGEVSYASLWMSSGALARGLHDRGIGTGSVVGILARNHRGFVRSLVAASRLGADIVYLNTGFAGPQLASVSEREGVTAILHDDEFTDLVADCKANCRISETEMSEMAANWSLWLQAPPRHQGATVILTSGTTGTPKGARREGVKGASTAGAVFEAIPFRARDTVVIGAPLFHAWGLSNLAIALTLSCTVTLQRNFDPEATLAAVAEQRADGLVLVPVLLQRLLSLNPAALDASDTSSLRYIASSGSALGASLAGAAMERFGPVLYNVYGSTEVALATIAGPADLQDAPATAGRPLPGIAVRVLEADGQDAPPGVVGRVFVGNPGQFEGYTGGGSKETVDGLMSIGDVGHFDDQGRLFIDGRDDDMIVSGGENVYPAEIEELLVGHPDITDAAVTAVADEEFGQRLRAIVVLRAGATLDESAVKDFVRSNLARYKVPREVVFAESVPRTTTGKLRRGELC